MPCSSTSDVSIFPGAADTLERYDAAVPPAQHATNKKNRYQYQLLSVVIFIIASPLRCCMPKRDYYFSRCWLVATGIGSGTIVNGQLISKWQNNDDNMKSAIDLFFYRYRL